MDDAAKRPHFGARALHSPVAAAVWALAAVVLVVVIPGIGVLFAFALALIVLVLGWRHGARRELGMSRPHSWSALLARTVVYGFVLQALTLLVIEPALTAVIGAPVDLENFDAVRGNVANYLVLLAVGWVVGGFIEELTFRGFLLTRASLALGGGRVATAVAVLVASVPFGLAHMYQGWTGVISTALMAAAFGVVFVLHGRNLWYAVFTHGFVNFFGITAIYTSWDLVLLELLSGG